MTRTCSDVAHDFDAIWPREAVAFGAMLRTGTTAGAEADHAVSMTGGVVARAFLAVVDLAESVDDLRETLRLASTEPLDPTWAKGVIRAILDETSALPALTDDTKRQIHSIEALHDADVTGAQWRGVRKMTLSSADVAQDALDATALEIAGAMAWPASICATTLSDVLKLLCETRADITARDAGIVYFDPEKLQALYQSLFDERAAAEKAGEALPDLSALFATRHPDVLKRLEDESAYRTAAINTVGTRVLRGSLDR